MENSSVTPHEVNTFGEPDLPKEAPASGMEVQLKTERILEEASPARAVIVKQEVPYEQIALPRAGPAVLRASLQTTLLGQVTEGNLAFEAPEQAILKLADRLCSEVPTGPVDSGVPGVGETLRREARLPVALVA
jgi:hypothetical protein